ncbi:hypothetical protein GCM10023087_16850 [Microbacterium rhizosphaerae]
MWKRRRAREGMKKGAVYRQRLGAADMPRLPLVQCRRTSNPSASMVRMRGVLAIGSPSLSQAFRVQANAHAT